MSRTPTPELVIPTHGEITYHDCINHAKELERQAADLILRANRYRQRAETFKSNELKRFLERVCSWLCKPPERFPDLGTEAKGVGCSLLWDERNNGSFHTEWSKEAPSDGALAVIFPSRPVPHHYFMRNGGRSELVRGVGTPAGKSQRTYYKAWASFIHMGDKLAADFHFLANVEKLPVSVLYLDPSNVICRLMPGDSTGFKGKAACAVPEFNDTIGPGYQMSLDQFQQRADKVGASVRLTRHEGPAPTPPRSRRGSADKSPGEEAMAAAAASRLAKWKAQQGPASGH